MDYLSSTDEKDSDYGGRIFLVCLLFILTGGGSRDPTRSYSGLGNTVVYEVSGCYVYFWL